MNPRLRSIPALLIFCLVVGASPPALAELTVDGIGLPVSVTIADDKSLPESEAVFEFVFHRPGDGWGRQEIRFAANGQERKIRPDAKGRFILRTSPGAYVFQFYIEKYREVTTSTVTLKPRQTARIDVHFLPAGVEIPVDKPVIYVYPAVPTDVKIGLEVAGALAFAFPPYRGGWSFTADPDGSLHFGDKTYRYLFWDGVLRLKADEADAREGFVVGPNGLLSFLESRLSRMGFNDQEVQDFLTYWYPRMKAKGGSLFIRFLFNEDCDRYARLTVSPAPDRVFRVYMIWSPADPSLKVNEPALPRFDRSGFSVLEWGGMEASELLEN